MKQEEKNRRSYDKILQAAIAEFGTKSYGEASLNAICNENHIAKGLLYHYFKSKDALYLRCVELCFQELTDYLQSAVYDSPNFRENLKKLLQLRSRFFQQHPDYSNIFFHAVLQPPMHLRDELKRIRQAFDDFHASRYQELLQHIKLREGITDEAALNYFFAFQEMFNTHFQNRARQDGIDLYDLITDHEERISDMLDIMLFGIAKENAK